ncbi:MAG TPA: hypothetical protein VH593_06360 [Ktedonobacteraceae bacterium]
MASGISELVVSRFLLTSILVGIDMVLFIGGYGLLRAIRVSVNWITWIIGAMIIAASMTLCISIIAPQILTVSRGVGNVLGGLSFLITMYAAMQWVARKWFIFIKSRTIAFIVKATRNFLMFLRKQHIFFGWLVGTAALAHMAVYLPVLTNTRGYEIITGFVAIGILAVIAALGAWMWIVTTLKKQRMPQTVHTIHAALTIAFLVALAAHI